jgi:hypothetical protein
LLLAIALCNARPIPKVSAHLTVLRIVAMTQHTNKIDMPVVLGLPVVLLALFAFLVSTLIGFLTGSKKFPPF